MLQFGPSPPHHAPHTHCAVCVLSRVRLCNLMDCRLPGSSVHGILQARILEGVATPSSRGSSSPRDLTHIFCVSRTSRWILDPCPNWEAMNLKMSHQPPLCRTHVHLLLLFPLFHSPGSWAPRSSPQLDTSLCFKGAAIPQGPLSTLCKTSTGHQPTLLIVCLQR